MAITLEREVMQLTGRSNYTRFQSYYNKHYPNDTKDFLNNEEHRKELTTNGKIAFGFGITQSVIRLQINKLAIMPMK